MYMLIHEEAPKSILPAPGSMLLGAASAGPFKSMHAEWQASLCQVHAHTSIVPEAGGMLLGSASFEEAGQVVARDLSGQCIRWVAPAPLLAPFTSLMDLNLSDNELPSLACLAPLLALHTLRLPANRLTTLGTLPRGAFPALEHLDLSFNQLKNDPVGLHGLAALPRLRHLDLSGGVIPSFSKYTVLTQH